MKVKKYGFDIDNAIKQIEKLNDKLLLREPNLVLNVKGKDTSFIYHLIKGYFSEGTQYNRDISNEKILDTTFSINRTITY